MTWVSVTTELCEPSELPASRYKALRWGDLAKDEILGVNLMLQGTEPAVEWLFERADDPSLDEDFTEECCAMSSMLLLALSFSPNAEEKSWPALCTN